MSHPPSDGDESEEEETPRPRDPTKIRTKFEQWLRLKAQGISFNERLVGNRAFHNPNIAVKMLEFMGVNEHGTNLPAHIYDPNDFPLEADYEAMAQQQRSKWEQSNSHPAPGVNIAPPYLHAPSSSSSKSVQSRRHQIMLERFNERRL